MSLLRLSEPVGSMRHQYQARHGSALGIRAMDVPGERIWVVGPVVRHGGRCLERYLSSWCATVLGERGSRLEATQAGCSGRGAL